MGEENTECLTRRLKERPASKSCQNNSGVILATSSGMSVLCRSPQRKPMIVPLQTSPKSSKEATGQGHTGQRRDSLL